MGIAYEIAGLDIPLKAAADLSEKQFFIMRISTDSTVNSANTTTWPFGVLQNDPAAAGRAASVRISGLTYCLAGDTVVAGRAIAPDAAGEGVHATADSYMIGIAVTGASDGEKFCLRIGTGACAN